MSRRDVLRRRLAPAVFIIGMAFIVQHTCMKAERHHATIELDFGDAKASTRAVDAQLRSFGSAPEDEAIATFRRVALPDQGIGPCRFEVAMPEDTAELVVDVTLTTGHRRTSRTIHADEGATVTVRLGSSLAAQP